MWPQATSARLPQVQRLALYAVAQHLRTHWHTSTADPVADRRRQNLNDALITLRAVQTDTFADALRRHDDDRRWPVTVGIQELAELALAAPAARPAPSADECDVFLGGLERVADSLTSAATPPIDHLPALTGWPRLTGAFVSLAAATADARAG